MSAMPLQTELSCLSVPYFLTANPAQEVVEHDAFSRSCTQPSAEQTKTSTIEFAAAFLASSQVSDAGHTQPLHRLDGEAAAEACMSMNILEICFEPERILRTPMSLRPKRFPLTFWRSAALRLLKRAVKAAASRIAIEVIE